MIETSTRPGNTFRGSSALLLSEAFDYYRDNYIVMANQSPKTEESYMTAKRVFVKAFGDINISNLTFSMIRDWKISIDKRVSPDTARGYIVNLRVVIGYLRKNGYDVIDPEIIPLPKRTAKIPSFISCREVDLLVRNVTKKKRGYSSINRARNGAIISLLYASGIRVSELCQLNRSDIQNQSFTVIGKGGKPRLCFLDDKASSLLNEYLKLRSDNNPALFLTLKQMVRMRPHDVQDVFRYARTAEYLNKPISPHTLRHSFSTNFLQNNGNMRYLQELLGHSNLNTTQVYAHVVNKDLEAAYRKYHKTIK